MDFTLKIEYPAYFIVFCLIAGLAYAFLTYYRSSFGEKGKLLEFPNYLLALLRFLSVSLIAFLLLSPFLKDYYKEIEKPVVAVITDNSESITLNRDSVFYQDSFPKNMNNLVQNLGQSYEVSDYIFGEKLKDGKKLNYEDKKTNLAAPLDGLYNRYYNRNLGAVILASDGIYNEGKNPLITAKKIKAPVYSVALGDTVPPKDLFIRKVRHNKVVFAGNEFPLEVDVNAEGLKGKSSAVNVSTNGERVFSQKLPIREARMDTTMRIYLEAGEAGLHKYTVDIPELEDEVSKVNNTREFFVNVLESKKKILIVGQSPHPDMNVLKQAIETNDRYKAETYTYSQWQNQDRSLEPYNFVFTHELPGQNGSGTRLLKKVKKERKPLMLFLGRNTNLRGLNNLDMGINVQSNNNRVNEVLPSLVDNFTQFKVNEKAGDVLKTMPPVVAPHGDYAINTQHSIFLKQKIGQVVSDKPLMAFLRNPNHKVGIFNGTGIWQWYLNEYRLNENHEVMNGIFSKAIQLMSVKENKEQFRLRDPKRIFNEDERVVFEAELYNNSYEPVEGASINFQVRNEEGDEFEFEFREISNGYKVDAGFLPAGEYEYTAKTQLGEETFELKGGFIIKPVQQEHLNTVADHQLLYTLAEESGGELFYPRQLNDLKTKLQEQESLKTVSHREYKLKELIHNKWLFIIVLFLLSLEWFSRKYHGGY